MYIDKKKSVAKTVEDAFADIEYPGDDKIVYSDDDWETPGVKSWLQGKDWREVNLRELLGHDGFLWLLTPDAYRYYIPSCLLACFEDSSGSVYESVIATLAPPPVGIGSREDFLKRVQGFSKDQKKAIAAFFLDSAQGYDDPLHNEPSQALEDYWGAEAE